MVFLYQGWLELDFLTRPMRRLRRGNSARIDDTNSSQKVLAEERAMMEENRRKEEASRRRSFGKAARNVEVFHQKQSMATNSAATSVRSPSAVSMFSSANSVRSPMQAVRK